MEEGHMSSPVMRKGLRGDDAAELETEKMRMMEKEDDMKEGKHEVEEGKHEVEEGKHEVEEGKHEVEEGKHEVEEELSLEELLSEEAHEEEEEEVEGEETEETEIDLEDMTEEDLTKFVEEVIKDMVEAGELEAGDAMEEMEEGYHSKMEEGAHDKMEEGYHSKMEEGAHDKMEEGAHDDMKEGMGKEKMEEELSDADQKKVDKEVDAVRDDLDQIAKLAKDAGEDAEDIKDVIDEEVNEELAEAYKVINKLRRDINEVNLLNSKLLYTNKIFRNKNLTESQKVKVLNSFDKAETVKEVKLVFESLSTAFVAKKSNIKESMGFASKPTGKAPINESAPVVQEDAMVARFKKLAGL
jgi:colicin import membrane protein